MALRSLVRNVPALGRVGRPVQAAWPAAAPRLMSHDRQDSFSSEQELARQREKIDHLRADYEQIREKLGKDMDALLELMRRDSDDLSRFHRRLGIFEKAMHVFFLGVPAVFVTICVKYDINVLVPAPGTPSF